MIARLTSTLAICDARSMRRTILFVGLLVVACTPSTTEPAQPSVVAEAKPAPADPVPKVAQDAAPCEQLTAKYLADRKRLGHCNADSDCAEMWPGLCPHGPYYINRDADITGVLALEEEILTRCEVPECEPPMELGIGRCDAGVCVPGRLSARDDKGGDSCWDYRETWLEADGSASATTSRHLQGITPHIAIAPAHAGTLVLELDWPADCADCRLLISEHNSGMAQLLTPTATRTQAQRNGSPIVRERLEFPVTPGPYHLVALAEKDADYFIRASLVDSDGKPGRVTRHGVGWQHMCEG